MELYINDFVKIDLLLILIIALLYFSQRMVGFSIFINFILN